MSRNLKKEKGKGWPEEKVFWVERTTSKKKGVKRQHDTLKKLKQIKDDWNIESHKIKLENRQGQDPAQIC